MGQDQLPLPGTSVRRVVGRHERKTDEMIRARRRAGLLDAAGLDEGWVVALRSLARAIDACEGDPDRAYTLGHLNRVYLDAVARMPDPPVAADDPLLEALNAAVAGPDAQP